MRTALLFIFSLAISFVSAKADNVYLSSGIVYQNVIVDTSGAFALIDLGVRVDTVAKATVLKIVWKKYISDGETSIRSMTDEEKKYFATRQPVVQPIPPARSLEAKLFEENPTTNQIKKESPNGIFLAVAALSTVVAWNSFATASDNSDAIDSLKTFNDKYHANIDVSRLESAKTRNTIFGVVAGILGIVFTVYAVLPVEVSASPDKLSVAVKF